MERREFIKKVTCGSAAIAGVGYTYYGVAGPAYAFSTGGGIGIQEGLYILDKGKEKNTPPEIRPEILANPRAVFLIETHIDAKRDGRGLFSEAQPQLEDAGKKIAQSIFVKGSRRGGSTAILPNFTYVPDTCYSPVIGIITSPDFVAGFTEGLRELGNTNVIVTARGPDARNHRKTGIYDVSDSHEINLIEASYARYSNYEKSELNWVKVPKPVVWRNIPVTRPLGDKDTFFINMAKLKCHNLGLTTLTTKNLQGAVPTGYGHYCDKWEEVEFLAENSYMTNFKRDFLKNYRENVESAFLKHRAEGFKLWDTEGTYAVYEKKGGWETFSKIKDDRKKVIEFMKGFPGNLMWDEMWIQRALDSSSAIKPTINIIEGIIGRDGSGFDTGKDELCNIVIVGQSTPEVDAVGSYIMGHDPCELPYTRVAKERGLGECDLTNMKLYWIKDTGDIIPIKAVSDIKRYRLGVNYHNWTETGKRLFW